MILLEKKIFEELSESEKQITVILFYSKYGCEKEVLQYFLKINPNETLNGLQLLINKNLILEKDNIYFIRYTIGQDTIKKFFSTNIFDCDFFNILFLYNNSNFKDFFTASYTFLYNNILHKNAEVIKRLYEIFSVLYVNQKIVGFNVDILINFIDKSCKIIAVAHIFPWNIRETLILILKSRAIAYKIHKKYYISLCNLSLGYICVSDFSNINKKNYLEIARKEINFNEELNNKNIDKAYMPFKSFIYYLDGNFIRSINCMYSYDTINNENLYVRIIYVCAAMSSIINGEYDIAINILDKGIKETEHLKINKIIFNILNILKALAFMCKGDMENSKSILKYYEDHTNKFNFTMDFLWNIRLTAYYYYLIGDIKQSYAIYAQGIQNAMKNGYIFTGYLLAPFMLEIFTAYHLSGFKELFNTSIFNEIKVALSSQSVILHIVAYRSLAEILSSEKGWHDLEAQNAIQSSLKLSYTISAPIERLKTILVYTRMLIFLKKYENAFALVNESLTTAKRYPNITIPQDIQTFFSSHPYPLSLSAHSEEKEHLIRINSNISPETNEQLAENYFVYSCDEMCRLNDRIKIIAPKNASVLILGESGVGKEHIARKLHTYSGKTGEFIAVNLSSIPEELFESEFFGHEKGSFTGAISTKKGLFELADKGTLFLDEIGDISMRMQIKLLRVLQEKEFLRIGGTKLIKSNFRLVSATNKNLLDEVKKGVFRRDIYYRLDVIRLDIPPLCKRGKDVLLIADNFISFFSKIYNVNRKKFSDEDINFLLSYQWPGNVRELRNYVERYVLFSDQEPSYTLRNIKIKDDTHNNPVNIYESNRNENFFVNMDMKISNGKLPTLKELESKYIEYLYLLKNGVVGGEDGIAKTLDISKPSVYNWIKRLNLTARFTKKIL